MVEVWDLSIIRNNRSLESELNLNWLQEPTLWRWFIIQVWDQWNPFQKASIQFFNERIIISSIPWTLLFKQEFLSPSCPFFNNNITKQGKVWDGINPSHSWEKEEWESSQDFKSKSKSSKFRT